MEQGERPLASCGPVHATERALIYHDPRQRRQQGGSAAGPLSSLRYENIVSLQVVGSIRVTTVFLGLLVVVMSGLVTPPEPLLAISVFVGLVAVAAGFLSGDRVLEVRTRAGDRTSMSRWALGDASGSAARVFVETVRRHMANPPAEAVADPASVAPRSVLVVPADRPERVREALGWGQDAICLDLARAERPGAARQMIWAEVAAMAYHRRAVWVRVDPGCLEEDLSACVWPGLEAVVAAAESGEDLRELEDSLASLEPERGVPAPVAIVPVLASSQGLWAAREIAAASPRVHALALGLGDLVTDAVELAAGALNPLGRPRHTPSYAYRWGRASRGAESAGVPLLGQLDMAEASAAPGAPPTGAAVLLAEAVWRARRSGFSGAFTPHRRGVDACNAGFDPSTDGPLEPPAVADDGGAFGPVRESEYDDREAIPDDLARNPPQV